MSVIRKEDKSMIVAHGPFKCEYVRVEAENDNDTFDSKLANPAFATIQGIEGTTTDGSEEAVVVDKTITMNNVGAAEVFLVCIYGDDVW